MDFEENDAQDEVLEAAQDIENRDLDANLIEQWTQRHSKYYLFVPGVLKLSFSSVSMWLEGSQVQADGGSTKQNKYTSTILQREKKGFLETVTLKRDDN